MTFCISAWRTSKTIKHPVRVVSRVVSKSGRKSFSESSSGLARIELCMRDKLAEIIVVSVHMAEIVRFAYWNLSLISLRALAVCTQVAVSPTALAVVLSGSIAVLGFAPLKIGLHFPSIQLAHLILHMIVTTVKS